MSLRLSAENEAFREEVRAFLRENLPPDMAARNRRGYHPSGRDMLAWTRILHRRGWSGVHWPKEHGGTGWTPLQQHLFEEECFLAGAPPQGVQGFTLVGPVIYTFGNEEQKRRFLSPILAGESFWGQGFSEPNAGSDLASLKTRAVLDGDRYIVNGQKTWTSEAQYADYLFCLVRTDPDVKPQRGLSFLLVDAKSPGITIRPIISIDEAHSLNEVFFEDVTVPAGNLVGEPGKGWTYAKFLLENERAFSAEVPRNKRNMARLKSMARVERAGGRPLIEDPTFAVRLAELEVELIALESATLQALAQKQKDADARPLGSILKIRGSELQQKLLEMQVEALGDYAAVFYPEPEPGGNGAYPPGPDHAPGIMSDFLYRRAATIYGGANEIQRTIIAKQILGL